MENVVIVIILAAIASGIVMYLLKAKKRGEKCIGCPYAKNCGGHCDNVKKHSKSNKK